MSAPAAHRHALIAALFAAFLAATAVAQRDELQDANQLFKQGQLGRALERVDVYLKGRPKDARGRFLKGLILTGQNKPNEAIKVFTELTQEFPELPEPYNNLAVLYASQGQYDKAREALEMAIRTHPSYATAHENLGDIYAKLASQAYDKALQLDRTNTTAQTKLNLIKDLFPGGPQAPKPDAAKPGPSAGVAAAASSSKPAAAAPRPEPPAKVAAATPPAQPTGAAPKEAARTPGPPAGKAAPPKPPTGPASARSPEDVLKAVSQWAKAWSENDVAGYLAYYAPGFKTPKGEPRAAWEAQRKSRIAKPRRIRVVIQAPKVVFRDDDRVAVTFRQNYRSDALKVTTTKTLVMVKSGGKWLIQEERAGG